MDATNFNKEKMELEHLQKQNQTLRLLFEEMSKKYNMLQEAYLEEANSNFGSYDECSNKGRRSPQIPAMAKASYVFVKTDPRDKSLIVKDGYQWRKYGQKVTKNNPSPRAYFKCSVTPDCPVKKKVQRCMENGNFVMVTYEGQHKHDVYPIPTPGQSLSSSTTTSFSTITLDLTRSGPNLENSTTRNYLGNVIQDYSTSNDIDYNKRIKDYVATLTKDRSFTAALAAAVARSIIAETA